MFLGDLQDGFIDEELEGFDMKCKFGWWAGASSIENMGSAATRNKLSFILIYGSMTQQSQAL